MSFILSCEYSIIYTTRKEVFLPVTGSGRTDYGLPHCVLWQQRPWISTQPPGEAWKTDHNIVPSGRTDHRHQHGLQQEYRPQTSRCPPVLIQTTSFTWSQATAQTADIDVAQVTVWITKIYMAPGGNMDHNISMATDTNMAFDGNWSRNINTVPSSSINQGYRYGLLWILEVFWGISIQIINHSSSWTF